MAVRLQLAVSRDAGLEIWHVPVFAGLTDGKYVFIMASNSFPVEAAVFCSLNTELLIAFII